MNAWAPPLKMTVLVLQLKVPLLWVQLPDTLTVPVPAFKVPLEVLPCKVKFLVVSALDPLVKVPACCTNPLVKVRPAVPLVIVPV